eukprot:Gb_32711 [translate_table: standard]
MNPHRVAFITLKIDCFNLICHRGRHIQFRSSRTETCRLINSQVLIFMLHGRLIVNDMFLILHLFISIYIQYCDSDMQPSHFNIFKRYPLVMPLASSQITNMDSAVPKVIIDKVILVTDIQNKQVW